ncbi:MAG TPA: T9SS type A sorting domain-containing protein, partial [Flavobacterium sp.]|nr:T9SS type A sorting domain-containing protein [Flavobacterium sp.]
LSAQNPLKLSWDKTGCQPIENTSYDILLNEEINSAECLQVCKKSSVTYAVSGDDLANIESISWDVTGGAAEYPEEKSTLIRWDGNEEGLIKIHITFIDGNQIDRTICIRKIDSSLIFSWDKIGCQQTENRVTEINFDDNITNMQCLKVCKNSDVIYGITGDEEANIEGINWEVTGGEVISPDAKSTVIKWDATATGLIRVRVWFSNGNNIERNICIQKAQSNLLFSWNKMVCQLNDTNLNEFKFDKDVLYAECLLVCENDESTYKISGYDMSEIEAIHWTVIGGTAETPNEKTTTISWDETEEGLIQVNLLLIDGTIATGIIYASKTIVGGGDGQNAQNAIAFDYDTAGNQTMRKMIYLGAPRRRHRKHLVPGTTVDNEIRLIPSDEYANISYYPNPVKSELYVQWIDKADEDMQSIEMYDISGKLINKYPNQSDKNEITIDFERYPRGIYELKLNYAGGEKKTLKIVKQ